MQQENQVKSVYLHIPFCKRKCNYCAFISYTNIGNYEDIYVDSLIKDITASKSNAKIETIYFGGGTPNLLSLKSLEKIMNALKTTFSISENAEITMEFNPKLSDLTYYKEVKNLGINRISLGVQSFNDKILMTLNRIHDSKEAFKSIENIQNSGITNFSIDIMYGIFGQTIKDLNFDLKIIENIGAKHISTYGLKIEENTPFAKFDKKNLPDEDTCAQMYLSICEKLKEIGYKHYEVSNFAKENFEAKHNLTYWRNEEYFGFGAAAHGYIGNIRYKNNDNLEEYIRKPLIKETTSVNTIKDVLEEKIFLGLRLSEGINLQEIKEKYDFDLLKKKESFINQLISSEHAKLQNGILSLTDKGFLISNYILGELLA